MLKWVTLWSLVFVSCKVLAHSPNLSSTLLAQQGEGKWVVQIRASLTAFEYEIHQHEGADSYATPEEFQQLVLKHVKANLSILFNESHAAVLQHGLVKLGHETSVVFEVKGVPDTIESLAVQNSSFSHISRSQIALIVLKKGFSTEQFILNQANEYTLRLNANDARFELLSPEQAQPPYLLLILIISAALLALAIGYFYLKKTGRHGLNSG
ncbi:MAG: hypothetical protein D6730_08840 [Bacteroidetes bacterium]|nr:MAG: hypothetical protein D6730_08840 [Bacteroidota bacterium]